MKKYKYCLGAEFSVEAASQEEADRKAEELSEDISLELIPLSYSEVSA